jgi:hypothetical protein
MGEDGTVTEVANAYSSTSKDSNGNTNKVVMLDKTRGQVTISKVDATDDSKEVSGAKLTLTATKDIPGDVSLTRTDSDGTTTTLVAGKDYTVDGKSITFTSSTVPTLINNLEDGTYTLTEVNAPAGYLLSTANATFTIQNGTVTGSTSISDEPISVDVSKTDVTGGSELAGATLTITAKDSDADLSNVYSDNATVTVDNTKKTITFTSTTTATKLSGIPAGEYTLTETTAPAGYTIAESIDFTVTSDGTTSTVTMKDALSTVSVSKVDVDGAELDGAVLTITSKEALSDEVLSHLTLTRTSSDGTTTKLLANQDYNVTDKTTIKFTSSTVATDVNGLPDGTYTIHEESAPDGYLVTADATFTIKDGKVTSDSTTKLVDERTSVTISKVEILEDGSNVELEGATLTITHADSTNKKDLSNVKATQNGATADGFQATADVVTFKSVADYSTVVEGLPAGTYVLTETSQPEGYELASSIEFTVKADGTVVSASAQGNTVVMVDELTTETTTTTEESTTTETTTTTEESTTTETTTTTEESTTTVTTTVPTTTSETTTTAPTTVTTTTPITTTTVPTTTSTTTTTAPTTVTTTTPITTTTVPTTTSSTTTTAPTTVTTTTSATTTVPTTTSNTTTTAPTTVTTTTSATTTVPTTTSNTTTTAPTTVTTTDSETSSVPDGTIDSDLWNTGDGNGFGGSNTGNPDDQYDTSTTQPTESETTVSTTVPSETTETTVDTTTVPSDTTETTVDTTTVPSDTTETTVDTTTVASETTETTVDTTTVASETTETTVDTTTVASETTETTVDTTTTETTTSDTTTTTDTTTDTTTTSTTTTTTNTTTTDTTTSTSDTTTTTTTTTTGTGTGNGGDSTGTSMSTTSAGKKSSSPSTGDDGVATALVSIMLTAAAMVATRKRHD